MNRNGSFIRLGSLIRDESLVAPRVRQKLANRREPGLMRRRSDTKHRKQRGFRSREREYGSHGGEHMLQRSLQKLQRQQRSQKFPTINRRMRRTGKIKGTRELLEAERPKAPASATEMRRFVNDRESNVV
jgi:hypothetical protein